MVQAAKKVNRKRHSCPHCNLGFLDLSAGMKHVTICRSAKFSSVLPWLERVEPAIAAIRFVHAYEEADRGVKREMYVCVKCYHFGFAKDVEPIGRVIPEFCPECGESSVEVAAKHIAFIEERTG